ncbi:MAG: LLM class flavin-dependent oxidoreductase, partial [Anaerolineaceae bacterium]
TQKIELGTGVTRPILRYHPAVVAQAAATLGAMAPGRVYLGLGTGEALNDYSATGLWPEYNERRKMLAEAITPMRELWTGDQVTFQGDYFETKKAKLYTLPDQPVPIYISSMVPESADFAGKYGDGLFSVGGREAEEYRQIFEEFDKGAREVGKDPAKMPRLLEVNVAYTQDLERVIEAVRKYWVGTYIPALFTNRIYTPDMAAKNGEPVGRETILKSACFSSDPQEHIGFIKQYAEYGFTQIYVHSADPNQKEFLENYGRDILPELKKLGS